MEGVAKMPQSPSLNEPESEGENEKPEQKVRKTTAL